MNTVPMQPPIDVLGAHASPYTRKMIAVLRFRRIYHVVHWGDPRPILDARGLPAPKVALLPTVLLPVDQAATEVLVDSTPIIRRLEALYTRRCVRPKDPVLAMIDSLLEDFGDEWMTKLMFHYRWNFDEDAQFSAVELPLALNPQLPLADFELARDMFRERQVGRLRYVGSNPTTAPVIERAYERLLGLLQALVAEQPFLLGNRPSASDFAFFGQLSQLALFDPTPRQLAHQLAPRCVAWVTRMDDLSGLTVSRDDRLDLTAVPEVLRALLAEVGRVYAPLLIANASAVETGTAEFATEVDGCAWAQQTFPYQAKCLKALREEFAALTDTQQAHVRAILEGSGCEVLFP